MAINFVAGRASLVARFRASGLANDQGPTTNDALQLLYRDLLVRIDAHFACNLHCFFGDLARGKLRVLSECLSCRLCIRTTAADCRNSTVRLDHITLPAEQKCLLFI